MTTPKYQIGQEVYVPSTTIHLAREKETILGMIWQGREWRYFFESGNHFITESRILADIHECYSEELRLENERHEYEINDILERMRIDNVR